MKPSRWLKSASVLMLLHAVAHTIGSQASRSGVPQEEAVLSAMRGFHFNVMGSDRTYWDFFDGYAWFVTVAMVIVAAILWQVGVLSRTRPADARPLAITLLAGLVLIAVVEWIYFFVAPAGMTSVAVVLVAVAVWSMSPATESASVSGRGLHADQSAN